MINLLHRLWVEEDGQGLTEYGLILALVAVVVIGGLIAMGDRLQEIFGDILAGLTGSDPVTPPPA